MNNWKCRGKAHLWKKEVVDFFCWHHEKFCRWSWKLNHIRNNVWKRMRHAVEHQDREHPIMDWTDRENINDTDKWHAYAWKSGPWWSQILKWECLKQDKQTSSSFQLELKQQLIRQDAATLMWVFTMNLSYLPPPHFRVYSFPQIFAQR